MAVKALAQLAKTSPIFVGAKVAQRWAGLIDVTPDTVPVISPVEGRPGFIVATGIFGCGPGAGRLTADLVTVARPVVDPGAFRFSRFSDGSKIVPLTGV